MSRYLVLRIEENPRITVETCTEIVALIGERVLERIRTRNVKTREEKERPIGYVFCMTGAEPNTGWLGDCVVLDDKGFVKTGQDLKRDDLERAGWPLPRMPYLLESSRPGVFAVGDARAGNVKRGPRPSARAVSAFSWSTRPCSAEPSLPGESQGDAGGAASRGPCWLSPPGASEGPSWVSAR
jgi:thioredoxin reductase